MLRFGDNTDTTMSKAKEQWEEEAIERFRNFLGRERTLTYAITGRDVVVNPSTGENFDYQLQTQDGTKVAVEIFRLVESGEDLAKWKIWRSVIDHLKNELLSRGIKGYFISTPEFAVKKRDIAAYSLQLAGEIEKAVKSTAEEKFEYAGFSFSKMKDTSTVVFSTGTAGRSIDPRGTAASKFGEKLPKKNQQVAVLDHERILLVVNWAIIVDGEDAIRALSGFDFSKLQNVDKIFFESRENEFVLIYERGIVEAIKNKQLVNDQPLAHLILQYARYQLGDKNQGAFDYVKEITKLTGNIDWLDDDGAKENLVSFGEELVTKDSTEDAMWIVRQLHDDDDPNPAGTNDSDDPKGEYNYHAQILRGEDANIITTVRGHLCWLMMKIVAKNDPKHYTQIIAIMSRYLKEDNLYIRIQASYILSELWARRRATRNQDESEFAWKDEERAYIRQLTLDTIRANRSYPRVMEALLHVLNSVRDLNEQEAEEILHLFLETKDDGVLHDLAAFVIYFALFREGDSQYYGGKFDPAKFVSLLKEQIKNGVPSMSGSLSWHLWQTLKDKLLPYEAIKEYLPLFLEGEYAPLAMTRLAFILEELSTIAPDDALDLYERALQSLENYLKTKPKDGHQNIINATEEMLPILAKDPKRLIDVIGRLKNISMAEMQIYIGDTSKIFGSYQLVPVKNKEEVKSALKIMYEEMKVQQPYLPEIDWSK